MPPNRPTYSGGPVGATNGSMNSAVIPKPPGFYLGADGGAVLNKRKLDELVRQVTGGGEGFDSGEGLTAEVEEVRNYLRLDKSRSFRMTIVAVFPFKSSQNLVNSKCRR